MKKLLLFVTLLLLGANLSICYADAPNSTIPDQTLLVQKKPTKGSDGKSSTQVFVSLMDTEKDYCYYCESENTWHIYTCSDKVVYRGGEIKNRKALDWCWLRQDSSKKVFNKYQSCDFVHQEDNTPYEEKDRILDISSSPILEIVKDDKATTTYSKIQFHYNACKKDALQALNVTVSYKASEDNSKEITIDIDKDTTLAAGSTITTIAVTKNVKDALAVKSIRCGDFNEGYENFFHLKDSSLTIPFSEMGVSKDAAIKLEVGYQILNDKCEAVDKNLKLNISIDNHIGFVKALTTPEAKTFGIVVVLLLVIVSIFFCIKILDRNKRENKSLVQPTQRGEDNHIDKNEPIDCKSIIEKQRKNIEYLQGEKQTYANEIESLNGQLLSVKANYEGAKNQIANLKQNIVAKDDELAKNRGRLSKVQEDCELLKRDKEKLKTALQNIDSEHRMREDELVESYSRQIADLTTRIDTQRDDFIKELKEKDVRYENEVKFIKDEHLKKIDSIRQRNEAEIETLTTDFNARNKSYEEDSRQRLEGGKKLLEQILDMVNDLSSSALSTFAYGQWIERMLDGDSSNSLPVFYEAFATNEQPFETYRNIRALIESSVSDVSSWINILARLASYVSSEAIASDMQKAGADIKLLEHAFELMKIFMALYGYQCIAPKLFTGTVEECSDEFVRDNTDLFINKISGAVFREVKSGVVCDLGSVACVKLVEPSEGSRLIKGKVNSL